MVKRKRQNSTDLGSQLGGIGEALTSFGNWLDGGSKPKSAPKKNVGAKRGGPKPPRPKLKKPRAKYK